MTDLMVRFLRTLHIANIDAFDVDFVMCGWNSYDKKQYDMVISKRTPWSYELLREFLDSLVNITFRYTLRFSYIKRITPQDAINLFDDWYQTIYRIPSTLTLKEIDQDTLEFSFASEDELKANQSVVNDFKDFLNFISYDFIVRSNISEQVVEEHYSDAEKNAFVEAAKEEIDSSISESKEDDINDRNDVIDMIEKEHAERASKVEPAILQMMKENARQMAIDREKARLNRKGNYEPIDLIDSIDSNSDHVDFSGKVFVARVKDLRASSLLTVGVADEHGGAIFTNFFQKTPFDEKWIKSLNNSNVRIRGVVYYDEFSKMVAVKGHSIDLLPPDLIEKEEFEQNLVELQLHSIMSTQDAVTPMLDYCNYAAGLGHKAMAITDHGCVQGFPEAQDAAKKSGMKLLYGCEFYMIEDKLKYIFNPSDIVLNQATFVVFDLETSGLSARYDKIIEFGSTKIQRGVEIGHSDILIDPGFEISQKIQKLTNLTPKMLKGKPSIKEVLPEILEFIKGSILVTHNASFDYSFLQQALIDNGFEPINNPVIDTLALSRYLFPESRLHNLGSLCRNMEVEYDTESAHRADYDARVLNEVWQAMMVKLTKDNRHLKHSDLKDLETPKSLYRHLRPMHVIALAKNKAGLKDLYKLVSISNIEYLTNAMPKIPRSVLVEHRDNLIIGSACQNGEVWATASNYNEDKLREVISFYDYIEVQPPANYSNLWNMQELSHDDVEKYIKDIIIASKKENKLVCATGDVHYLSPKQKVFRDVYISALGVGKVNHPLNPHSRKDYPYFENPDQHYRTTKEMLECFNFLDEETAKEIVIKNTNIIADQIESLLPVPNDKLYTPKIEGCEENLKEICYKKAHDLYGEVLPEYIEKRLATELNGIISNGYSVIYYIAHKIIKKTNDDGYIVGSRGSVGSSFVATMANITEVNPLPPHYRCPKCKQLEWTKESMPEYRSGYDLPEKNCPHCGTPMVHDGQDIPFETFLGFNADKTPDIDLNFPGDYQARAHNYTKELLGENNVFRAGTIETVAEKTAFGFVRGYLERNGINPDTYSKAKIEYMANGCMNVKRTTGQNPGGIVVVPNDFDVYDFTPIQWPADEVDSEWKTTHFDFHSIHDTILKLDLLGHVDPMALKMMCDLTDININDIPMNDPNVIALFSTSKPLKLKGNYLAQKTGALAIPEFGTDFVRGILEDTSPKSFSDLVIISGLSHGTNVWNGNAEKLVKNKVATLQEVIGCRDDIMTYLIGKGLPSNMSFAIMEDVRKGKGLKPEFLETMKKYNIPQFYIDSCNLIKYMFPKGHAVAYVTMAVRVGYFKIYYPLEFYATFFSVRSDQYDIVPMIKGEQAIIDRIEELKNKKELSNKEKDQLKTLQIAIEMVQRGYSFSNIDLYKSDATKFIVDHETKSLIPPFITIDGLGANNAITVVEARNQGEFTSEEDLLRRTKLTKTNVNDLKAIGAIKNLNETDQISLFDFA